MSDFRASTYGNRILVDATGKVWQCGICPCNDVDGCGGCVANPTDWGLTTGVGDYTNDTH